MNTMYDVTAISVDDERVPLITTASESTAFSIAKHRSTDGVWQSLEIREADSGCNPSRTPDRSC